MEKRRVLITGLGTVNPLGHNAADTWQAVRDGVCGIGPITRYDCSAQKVHLAAEVKDWDPTTVLDKKDVRHMSRYTQLAAAAAKEALADSGLIPEAEDRTRCGVIVSSGVGGIDHPAHERLAQNLVGHLGLFGLHAGTRARSQNDSGSFHAILLGRKRERRECAAPAGAPEAFAGGAP